jgi:hypothetical protein
MGTPCAFHAGFGEEVSRCGEGVQVQLDKGVRFKTNKPRLSTTCGSEAKMLSSARYAEGTYQVRICVHLLGTGRARVTFLLHLFSQMPEDP